MAVSRKTSEKRIKKYNDTLQNMKELWQIMDADFPEIKTLSDVKDFQNMLISEIRKPYPQQSDLRNMEKFNRDKAAGKFRTIDKETFEMLDKCIKNLITLIDKENLLLGGNEDVKIQIEKIY